MEQRLSPGFLVVHANQAELLRDLVVQWLQRYPLAVLEQETLLVQSNGIAQWLKLALASDEEGLGVAAGIKLQMPGRFLWQLYRTLLPQEAIPEHSPFDKSALLWRLYRLLPACAEQPEFAVLRHYLAEDVESAKRLQLAARLADLFDQYQVYRADWLEDWQLGQDCCRDARGFAEPLPEAQLWQAQLWRRILVDMTEDERRLSRGLLHQRFLRAASQFSMATRPVDLPRRVIVFGISSLPQQTLQALAAVADYCQILLTVLNPCQHYWADIIADQDLLKAQKKRHAVRLQSTGTAAGHPLLASWGKQGRDYMGLLDEYDQTQQEKALFVGQRIDLFSAANTTHLLGQLQQDILELRDLPETKQHWPALSTAQAQSILFISAHSALREVEILHDDLLLQLQQDPSLMFRDIMVMVPDIHHYAAAIQAVFGRYDRQDPRYIPFTIADQSAQTEQPLLRAWQLLLSVRQQRFGLSDILDLLDVPALAAKFELSASDCQQAKEWLHQAGARLGLHQEHQQQQEIHSLAGRHSLLFALERLLLGYAFGDSHCWQQRVAFAGVSGLTAGVAGKLMQLVNLVHQIWQQAEQPQPGTVWLERLRQWLADLFSETEDSVQMLTSLTQSLHDLVAEMERAGVTEPMPLPVLVDSWLAPFAEAGLQQKFLAGAVNFASLMPMRAIPFRQVHLLGMNDGAFPRASIRQDFDLMQSRYRPGDRSRREDDRYLFLEALLSARDRLRISYIGRSVHDNSPLEPSVLVAQLRDHLAQGWQLQQGGDLLDAMTIEHPLQPFSRRYLQADPVAVSFQKEWQGFYQPTSAASSVPTLMAQPAANEPTEREWTLRQLRSLLRDPVSFYFQQRLQIHLALDAAELQDHEPFETNGLVAWQQRLELSQAMQHAVQGGTAYDSATLIHRWRLSGQWPLGPLAEIAEQEVYALGQRQWRLVQQCWPHGQPMQHQLVSTSAHGQILCDSISAVATTDDGMVHARILPDQLKRQKHWNYSALLMPWLELQCLGAATLTGEQRLIASDGCLIWPLPEPELASKRLTQLLSLLQQAMQAPLPLNFEMAQLVLDAKEHDDALWQKLRKAYHGDEFRPGLRQRNPYLARAFPEVEPLLTPEALGLPELFYQSMRDDLETAQWIDEL